MGKKKRMKRMMREKEFELKGSKSKMNWLLIITPIIAAIIGIGIFFAVSGGDGTPSGSSGNGDTNGTGGIIHPTWVTAQVEGNSLSIPEGEVDGGKMLHFGVTTGQGVGMAFMAYKSAGEVYVRANVCPPCRSESFSLAGDVLDCDTCHTKFRANTGEGITGACKDYPKAEVAHAITGGKVTMSLDGLVTAYGNTVERGWP